MKNRLKMYRLNAEIQEIFLQRRRRMEEDEVKQLIKTKSDVRAIKALRDEDCCKIKFDADGNVRWLLPGGKTYIYCIQREELWFNRLVSFALGVISGLLIAYISSKF